ATADRLAGDGAIAAVVEQDGYRAAAGRRSCAADRQGIQGERGGTAGGDGGDGGDGGRSTVHHGRIGGDVAEQRGGAVAAVHADVGAQREAAGVDPGGRVDVGAEACGVGRVDRRLESVLGRRARARVRVIAAGRHP